MKTSFSFGLGCLISVLFINSSAWADGEQSSPFCTGDTIDSSILGNYHPAPGSQGALNLSLSPKTFKKILLYTGFDGKRVEIDAEQVAWTCQVNGVSALVSQRKNGEFEAYFYEFSDGILTLTIWDSKKSVQENINSKEHQVQFQLNGQQTRN